MVKLICSCTNYPFIFKVNRASYSHLVRHKLLLSGGMLSQISSTTTYILQLQNSEANNNREFIAFNAFEISRRMICLMLYNKVCCFSVHVETSWHECSHTAPDDSPADGAVMQTGCAVGADDQMAAGDKDHRDDFVHAHLTGSLFLKLSQLFLWTEVRLH